MRNSEKMENEKNNNLVQELLEKKVEESGRMKALNPENYDKNFEMDVREYLVKTEIIEKKDNFAEKTIEGNLDYYLDEYMDESYLKQKSKSKKIALVIGIAVSVMIVITIVDNLFTR